MTLRTTSKLKCECGHEGILKTAENDQPYSSPWVKYDLEGFYGTVSEGNLDLVRCPTCGKLGKVDYSQDLKGEKRP